MCHALAGVARAFVSFLLNRPRVRGGYARWGGRGSIGVGFFDLLKTEAGITLAVFDIDDAVL
jgi:hypothetical protein